MPDYTTLCRWQKTLAVPIPCQCFNGHLNLIEDSTGLTFLGDCEPQARSVTSRADANGARSIYLALDTATTDIRAVEFTPAAMATTRYCRSCANKSPMVNHFPAQGAAKIIRVA